ncbi:hypothetical protein B296_00045244 [Ensete ventricosum]|uniref:Uncharacterized protein n=1 Tax=Ensete ventricosum TaxID=4639 RepID=A0A426X4C0_ENSVE|nr:hypothetical protein B296_00045244 [Ensete ventricosum]
MKNPWSDMISLLPLQEFTPLTSIQGKLCASAPCSIFYVDSLHVAWIFHQVPPKLLRFSICIELIVALASTIPRVSPPLSSISTPILKITIPFRLLHLVEQLVPCSVPANALARLRLFANTVPTTPFKWDLAEVRYEIRRRDREARWEHTGRSPEEDRKTHRKNAGGCRIGGN